MNYNTISEIEPMTEAEAKANALETLDIKGHTVYLVDFGGYFGYSALVFLNGSHIYYANDYELHHTGKARDELRRMYAAEMSRKLYTETEIAEPIKDYDEYDLKYHYLQNYYGQQKPHVSAFGIFHNEAEQKAHAKATAGKTFDPISYAYYDDADFVKHHILLAASLEKAKNSKKDSFEYWESAFYSEMCNHEYAINWQGNWDVLSVFGNIRYNDADDFHPYFDELNFTETQRSAFLAARKRYYKEHEDM